MLRGKNCEPAYSVAALYFMTVVTSLAIGQPNSDSDGKSVSAHAKLPSTKIRDVERLLQSESEAERDIGINAIAEYAKADPLSLAGEFSKWIRPLRNLRQYELIDEIGEIAILSRPGVVSAVSDIQAARVEALLRQNKGSRAMVEAKRYFNVATMKQSAAAINMVAIAARDVGGPAASEKAIEFLRLQVEDARKPVRRQDREESPYILPSNLTQRYPKLLASIKVDQNPYAAVLNRFANDQTVEGRMARGNLLLLADSPSAAKECFASLAKMESVRGKQLAAAVEGVARAIRAEDGNVGRANAFLQSLQNGGR